MRFLGVSSPSFGSIRHSSLTFASKFTVIYGPNEAGKSTWHAALYAAFCGMRRSRIQSRADEEFIEKYRPWNSSDPWEVRVKFLLQDGRNIEMRQELLDRMECRAVDVDFGRDYSNEIINEGSPDGSMWLGLDRRTFLATACIKQSQLLDVLSSPEAMQTHLQRAAATCAVNSTGAKALQLIESFRAEFVGEDRTNSTRPLYRALRRVDSVKGSLDAARAAHLQYLRLMASENSVKSQLEKLRHELNLARAVVADRDANDWERRLQRVQSILSNHPERPSGDLDRLNSLVREVSTALRIWQERPGVPDLSGLTAAEIEDQLERLPSRPPGDVEPDPQVLKAAAEFLASKYALTLHVQAEPSQPVFPETGGLSSEQLRQITSSMEEPEPQGDPRLEQISSNPVNERLIQRVHTAIEVWERRSKPAAVSSPTAEEIRRVIDTLPTPVEGDLEPTPEILEAANAHASAKEALRQNALNRPAEVAFPNIGSASPAELRTLALRLREQPVVSSFSNKIRVRGAARKELELLSKSRNSWTMAAGGLSLLALTPLAIAMGKEQPIAVAVAVVILGAVVFLVAKWKTAPILAKRLELEGLQGEADTESGPNEWARWQKDVQERIDKLRLPANADTLEALADEFDAAQDADRMCHFWKETENRLEKVSQDAVAKLQSLLSEKIAGSTGTFEDALAAYQQGCAERYHIAALASRRQDLERQLAAKVEAEGSAAEINQRRKSAEAELRQVAKACGMTGDTDLDLVKRLQEWANECDNKRLLQAELGQQAFVRVAWKQRQLEKREQVLKSNLPVNAATLRQLAENLDQAQMVKAAYEGWSLTLSRLTRDCKLRADQLRRLLEGKELEISEDLEEVLLGYRAGCEARALVAAEANRRPDLERQLVTRKQAEDAGAKVYLQRQNAHQELVTVAGHCAVPQAPEEQLAEDLRLWLNATTQAIRVQQEGLKEWRELDTLLEGRMLKDFIEKVQRYRDNALVLGSAFSAAELSVAISKLEQYEADMAALTAQVDSAAQELANVQGQIHSYEERPVSVSDAEEELRAAEEELTNIRVLDDTLETSHVFLSQAQDSVHRDIAPFLAEVIRHWLPEITLGRYVDARVNSQTLQVQVCDQSGEWRDASTLSHGTSEQIYLLLRLAMVEYLTKRSEVCPLILDDITLQSDARRKERILSTLKKVSEKRQVILFTQEEEVLSWARKNLSEPEGRIIELMATAV